VNILHISQIRNILWRIPVVVKVSIVVFLHDFKLCLFARVLFNDAISSSDYIAFSDGVINE
jgi:hypothetical protein